MYDITFTHFLWWIPLAVLCIWLYLNIYIQTWFAPAPAPLSTLIRGVGAFSKGKWDFQKVSWGWSDGSGGDTCTAENTVVSPNFLVWKFCGKAQFLHNFGRFTQNYAETVPFHKIPHHEIRWNYGIFRSVAYKFVLILD